MQIARKSKKRDNKIKRIKIEKSEKSFVRNI